MTLFYQQESEEIIKRIQVNLFEFSNYIRIPHKPVVKLDAQETTKIRRVFNVR